RNGDRGKSNTNADRGTPFSQGARDEKFVVTKAAVGSFNVVLCLAQFLFGVGIETGVGTRQGPKAGRFPRLFRRRPPGVRNKNLGALIGKGIVQLAPEQHSEIPRFELQNELGYAGGFPATIRMGGINFCWRIGGTFFGAQSIHAPFVSRVDFVWS